MKRHWVHGGGGVLLISILLSLGGCVDLTGPRLPEEEKDDKTPPPDQTSYVLETPSLV